MAFLNIFSKKPLKPKQKPDIIVDHREKLSHPIPHLKKLNFQISYRQLPVADYIINGTAIERKTLSDLATSIKNKRIIRQLLELKQYPSHLLLIEGNLNNPPKGIHKNALKGFLLTTALEFQTPILFTASPEDTALHLHLLAKKPPKTSPPIRPSKLIRSPKQHIQFILEGFPNIGPATAKKLLAHFPSLKSIFSATEEELVSLIGKKAQPLIELLNHNTKRD